MPFRLERATLEMSMTMIKALSCAAITVALTAASPMAHAQQVQPAQVAPVGTARAASPAPGAQAQALTANEAALASDVAVAKQDAKKSAEKATAAADEVAKVRSGKLISSGITGGVAGVVHFHFENSIKNTALGAMPYVMFHPAYWWSGEESRTYCASHWGGGDEDAASRAASGIARKKAARAFDAAHNALLGRIVRSGNVDPAYEQGVAKTYIEGDDDRKVARDEIVARIDSWMVKADANASAAVPDSKFDARLSDEKASIISAIADMYWNPTLSGKCFWHKVLGLWVGVPLSFETTTEFGEGLGTDARMKRNVSPTVAFGFGISPLAYVSLLAGFSINTIDREANPSAGATAGQVTAWTAVLGVGGNLDLLTLLKP
jgi:hypothetical protein